MIKYSNIKSLLNVIFTLNLLPTTTLSFKTHFEILFGFFPSYAHLHVFECLYYPNISNISTYKFFPSSLAYVYLGPTSDHKGYRWLGLMTQRIII